MESEEKSVLEHDHPPFDKTTQMDMISNGQNMLKADNDANEDSSSEAKNVDAAEHALPITLLPEVVLVNIMEYLTLKERYYLSLSCRLFYEMFTHPQLWQRAHIVLFPQGESRSKNVMKWKMKGVMSKTMAEIVKRFSHTFQHLSLEMIGVIQPFDDMTLQLLQDLSNDCRLESLTLKLGVMTSSDRDVRRVTAYRSNVKDIPLVISLIQNAVRLKHLNIVTWPLHKDQKEYDIFTSMLNCKKLKSLESLRLFYIEEKREQWTERIPKLPSLDCVCALIDHFTNLSHLALRSPMLSDEIIMALASKQHCAVNLLQVLVMYSRDSLYSAGFKIPDISPSSWTALKKSSPNLKVEYVVITRIPHDQMSIMLKPEVPLTSLSVLNFGRCDSALIESLAELYKVGLRKFISLCDSSDCDRAIVTLMDSCKNLTNVAYHGEIHYKTVIRLAEMNKHKKDQMERFEFKGKNIKTTEMVHGEEENDDVVVAKDDKSQEYYLVGLRSWHREEDQHLKKIDEMREQVSRSLGYTWRPCE